MNEVASARITAMCPQLLVSDLERSVAFYTDELGFTLDFRFEDFYAGVSRDSHCIHLKADEPKLEERRYRRENEHLDISFGVAGIDVLYDEIAASGVQVTQPIRTMRYGREFYVADPDGYILGFLELTGDEGD